MPTITYVVLLLFVFIVGFKLGKKFILKGLALRMQQLHQEGDYRQAWMIEEALKRNGKE